MTITRVKICGITQLKDAQLAIQAGADALGFVFYEKSPRYVDAVSAASIINKLPPFISKIGLFVNPTYEFVEQLCSEVNLDYLQFHGDETAEFCERFSKPYIKAIRMRSTTDLSQVSEQYSQASGLLVDAFDQSAYGGTGQTFDWNLLSQNCSLPLILAGGLEPSNVAQAIQEVAPYAVDVSSGVEASKGIKDGQLINQFIQEVRRG